MRRVVIVGSTGSGKTTLARELAAKLGLSHVELDKMHWGPGWSIPTDEAFLPAVAAAASGEEWVIEGN